MPSLTDTTQRSATISVLVDNEVGRPRARHRPVLRPRLQHRQPDGRPGRCRGAAQPDQHRDVRHQHGDRADQGAARPAGAGAPRGGPDDGGAACRARTGAGEGDRHRRAARRGDAHRRYVPRPGGRYDAGQLRVRADRSRRQDRRVHRTDAGSGSGRGVPQRHRRARPRHPGHLKRLSRKTANVRVIRPSAPNQWKGSGVALIEGFRVQNYRSLRDVALGRLPR